MISEFTIVAAATPPGRGGIGVVRVSGDQVKNIAKELLGKIPQPRYATLSPFKDENGDVLDEGIAIFFPTPNSFTGEDVLELHGHGGPVVMHCLIQRIVNLGAKLARPGEFSERAFHNNKLDLTQAEAIADLINASSEEAARSAVRSLQGEFSKRIQILIETLIRLRMYIEAAIDFVEEEINFLADQQIKNQLLAIINQLTETENAAFQGSLLSEGITVVIAGKPNVGKSSLLNCLSGKDSAIVTSIPGTTRDVLREQIHIDGIPLHLIDTAGLRESSDLVEQEGMRRAKQEIAKADIILHMVDMNEKEQSDFLPQRHDEILIRNKIDLLNKQPSINTENNKVIISLSAKENQGIDLLKEHIKSRVGFHLTNEGCFSARRRHLEALTRAKNFLIAAQEAKAVELLAEDLRQAQLALSEITGEFTADDLLGRIFSSFCIGK